MANVRIRSAILAILLGNLGVDLLFLRPHQVKLFLMMGGPLLGVAVLSIVLAISQSGAWAVLAAICGGLLTLWSIARCCEYLNLTDREFTQLLDSSNP